MSTQGVTQDAATEAVSTRLASHADAVSNEGTPTAQDAEARAWGEHPVNLRITVFGRYYVAIVAGKERRSSDRRIAERQKHPLDTLGNTLATLAFSTTVGLAFYALLMTLVLRWVLAP
jgi:hypothetical protein